MIRKVLTTPNKILHEKSRGVKLDEIGSDKIHNLIADIYDTLKSGEYGVGMSAIQVGVPLAVSVVMIRSTPTRPGLGHFNKVYLNPKIVKTFGKKEPMWEGCCSVLDERGDPVYAEVPRYKKITIEYLDEAGEECADTVDGFLAHVLQHEIDHNDGTLFTDLIPAGKTIPLEEYKKIVHK